jgi:two-component system, chemotaxis family, chemotaxis protein CheY
LSPILIVEDDADVRETLVEVLEDEGYRVTTAVDGLDALAYLRRTPELPRLILLDIMMPRMDGIAFRAEQVKEAGLANIPVAVVSADDQASSKASTLRANGFLRKPVKLGDLLALVQKLAGSPH